MGKLIGVLGGWGAQMGLEHSLLRNAYVPAALLVIMAAAFAIAFKVAALSLVALFAADFTRFRIKFGEYGLPRYALFWLLRAACWHGTVLGKLSRLRRTVTIPSSDQEAVARYKDVLRGRYRVQDVRAV
jgi:hypothetical protein